uniref:Uncharacterized protein n=1 Tax=Brassica oleracea var. oleracea TaxID=109376 RepID=A0A0D2ZXW5_BRAOL
NLDPQVDNEVLPPTQVVDDIVHEGQTQNPQELVQQDQIALRRSTRIRKNAIPDDYIVFLMEHEENQTLSEDDPITFLQAMSCSMSDKWTEAANEEYKSMLDN